MERLFRFIKNEMNYIFVLKKMAFVNYQKSNDERSFMCCTCCHDFKNKEISDVIIKIENKFYSSRILDHGRFILICPRKECQRELLLKFDLTSDSEHLYFYLKPNGETTKEMINGACKFFGQCVAGGVGMAVCAAAAILTIDLLLSPKSSE